MKWAAINFRRSQNTFPTAKVKLALAKWAAIKNNGSGHRQCIRTGLYQPSTNTSK